ncbi:tetraspanin-1-like [Ostrea edulis]|uniref:tetraspanin-1-like n=1 Tax=Ostrea edulis TaxID=37623 RepID=UPI0024AF23D6|nr:tetraspanin-1-like [Ostrea edulis]XP_056012426.1 tetraspanin-1-like [Ostrea edulis]XP_056012427.1 tetraspanin-1-like [Ostrea edulis]
MIGGVMLGRVFLISINTMLFILGVSITTAGILIKLNVKSMELEMNSTTTTLYEPGILTDDVAIFFIVPGVVLVLVAEFGLLGAYTRCRWMLITYANILLILLIVKIAVLALWISMTEKMEELIKMEMLKSLKANYINDTLNSNNEISNLWNNMFLTSDCCAVNPVTGNHTDFKETPWCKETIKCNLPRTCCEDVDADNYTLASVNCTSSMSGYKTMGCYDVMLDQVKSYSALIFAVVSSVLVIELMAIVFAYQIC